MSMIWGANLRGLEEAEVDSIGCGSERLSGPEPETEADVTESGELSCDVLSLLELRECLIFVSTGWGKARRAFDPLVVPRSAERRFADLFVSSVDWGGITESIGPSPPPPVARRCMMTMLVVVMRRNGNNGGICGSCDTEGGSGSEKRIGTERNKVSIITMIITIIHTWVHTLAR